MSHCESLGYQPLAPQEKIEARLKEKENEFQSHPKTFFKQFLNIIKICFIIIISVIITALVIFCLNYRKEMAEIKDITTMEVQYKQSQLLMTEMSKRVSLLEEENSRLKSAYENPHAKGVENEKDY